MSVTSLQDQRHRSITEAMSLAMGPMTAAISKPISLAFQQAQAVPLPVRGKGHRAPSKSTMPHLTDGPTVPYGVSQARKRACPCQAEYLRSWKGVKEKTVSDSVSDPESQEEAADYVDYESDAGLAGTSGAQGETPTQKSVTPKAITQFISSTPTLLDLAGAPLFHLDDLHHPRLSELLPSDHVTQYLMHRIRCPLSREVHNKIRAQSPRPTIPKPIGTPARG